MSSSRKPGESSKQYKIRVIDPISPSYCAAKWLNATIWLGHGQTTSCHHPPAHNINISEIEFNPSAIHNTQHKKMMRKLMLEGERPNECEYCWKVEDIGRDNISDRVYKTVIHSEEEIQKTVQMPWDSDAMLKTLEISFDRVCNFACSYCSPAFSTTWVRDIKKNGPYEGIIGDGRGHYTTTAPWANSPTEKEEDNPYIQAFWKWWNSGLADNLEEIRITGGEPLMAASVWKLFQWFKDNPERSKTLVFAINSNLVPKPELLDKLIELSHFIPHLEIYSSNESQGKHSEYIRDGMNYSVWLDNIDRLITNGRLQAFHMMMTINSLCLASITDFMDDMMSIKRKHGSQYCNMSVNILRFPSFQSCAVLPDSMKKHYMAVIGDWLATTVEKNEKDANGRPLLNVHEKDQIQRLIDYLDVVKTAHQHSVETPKLHNDFRKFYEQYDIRRGKNFKETFPADYVEFIEGIEYVDDKPIPMAVATTTAAGYNSEA